MRTWMIAIALVVGTGCGKGDDSGKQGDKPDKKDSRGSGAADVDELNRMKDEICACKDLACADPVWEKLDAKYKAMDKTYAESPNKNIMHHASEASMAAKECQMKLK